MQNVLKYRFFNDKLWLLVFFHDISTTKEFFNNHYESLYFFDDNKPNKFSIIGNITDYNKIDGSFEFFIEYDEKDYVQWKQSHNPIIEEENSKKKLVQGYEFINGIEDNEFGGLARTTFDIQGCLPSLLNGYINVVSWCYAIGMYYENVCYGDYDHVTLPGIKHKRYHSVSLWLRVLDKFSFASTCNKHTCIARSNSFDLSLVLICLYSK